MTTSPSADQSETLLPLADCQICSVVSKTTGEDPIGSARFASHGWLVVELPLPWTPERFQSDPLLAPILGLLHQLTQKGISVSPMAIAPDRNYSVPERSHVIYYRRPDNTFAQFEKQMFLVPPDKIVALIKALLLPNEDLQPFLTYESLDSNSRDMMICTHGNVDIACARFGQPIYSQLRKEYAAKSDGQLRVWRCSHFGGHQFAPTLVDFPTGQVWGHLEAGILDALIHRNQPVSDLRLFYRGWSGLEKYAQIVEREIWTQRGWPWLGYHKSAQITAQANSADSETPDWVELRLSFSSPDTDETGTYDARVEVKDSVMTAHNSGDSPVAVKQHRVNRLMLIE